jgi:hypothetical protein
MSEPKKPSPAPQVSRSGRGVADDHHRIRKDYVAGANGDQDVDASAAVEPTKNEERKTKN